MPRPPGKVGLVLGSGAARGWAHIGVIRELEENGIRPDIICGCSIGALVGAAYAAGKLDALENWVRQLSFWDVVRLLDVKFNGGLIEGNSLMEFLRDTLHDGPIEALSLPFAAVATDLETGQEIWLRDGPLLPAMRASIAMPGLFSPIQHDTRWLVDGGLVNPVPISLCRAMGAHTLIAVNLNSDIVGKHFSAGVEQCDSDKEAPDEERRDLLNQWLRQLNGGLREKVLSAWRGEKRGQDDMPGLLEVVASSINIMQDRITKSRMAGDPPDSLLTPRLGWLGLLEFDRAEAAITEGRAAARRALPELHARLNLA